MRTDHGFISARVSVRVWEKRQIQTMLGIFTTVSLHTRDALDARRDLNCGLECRGAALARTGLSRACGSGRKYAVHAERLVNVPKMLQALIMLTFCCHLDDAGAQSRGVHPVARRRSRSYSSPSSRICQVAPIGALLVAASRPLVANHPWLSEITNMSSEAMMTQE